MAEQLLETIEIERIIDIAKKAGDKILSVYEKDFEVEFKADESPLTEADKLSHSVIVEGLAQLGLDIPVLSEEGRDIPFEERKAWTSFWLIDPVDGTKEFVNKNGEFTVNIALIEAGMPVLGVVYAPVKHWLYYAKQGDGAFKEEHLDEHARTLALPVKEDRQEGEIRVVASKSHLSPETQRFIDDLIPHYPKLTTQSIGSSLKICLVAEGLADIYPRLGPTMEWDTGAAHAIALEAGKKLEKFDFEHGYQPHRYNKPNLLNDWFVVHG